MSAMACPALRLVGFTSGCVAASRFGLFLDLFLKGPYGFNSKDTDIWRYSTHEFYYSYQERKRKSM